MLSWSHCDCSHCFRTVRRDLPSSSSFTSLAAFSPSSRRFLSIILDLSAAALSSALTVQPMAPRTRPVLHRQAEKMGRASVQMPSGCASNGGVVPVSANTTLSGVLAHVIKKSPSLLSSTSKIPQNHLGFN